MKTKEKSEYLVNEFVNFLCYSGVNYQLYRNKREKVSKSPRRLCKFVAEPKVDRKVEKHVSAFSAV